MLSGAPIDVPIGVLAVTVHRAVGLTGTPDPYCALSIAGRGELMKTKTIKETDAPKWSETKYIIVTNLNDSLDLQIFDQNDFRADKDLGLASFGLDNLQEDPEQENITLPVMFNSKARGQVIFDVRFFPVLEGRILDDGTKEPPPKSNTGIARITLSQAKDLDSSKSLVGELSPYAEITHNGRTVYTTKVKKRKNDPIWEESFPRLIMNRKICKVGVVIKDERGFVDDPILGKFEMKLTDLFEKGNDWFNLTGAKSGRVKLNAQWYPVTIKGVASTGGYVTPIGVMRIHLQSAKSLRNLEALGKSDPYVRIMLSGIERARTVTFENDLNPLWDEVLYVPIHSTKERISLEVMDQEVMGKDKPLGSIELGLDEFVKEDSQGLFQVHDERALRSEGLLLGTKTTPKGILNYTVSFYPCINISDADDEAEEKKLLQVEKDINNQNKGTSAASENGSDLDVSASSSSMMTAGPSDQGEKKPLKIKMSPEELLRQGAYSVPWNGEFLLI